MILQDWEHTRAVAAILGCVVLFSLLTVFLQFQALGDSTEERLNYLEIGNQYYRHQAVLDGEAGNPWQYRLLADYMVEPLRRLTDAVGLVRADAVAYLGFRLAQNIVLFVLAAVYYRQWGFDVFAVAFGLALLAWSMSYATYDSDLQFNTYFDVIFYLLAVILILADRLVWIIPLMVLAAFNRETSGLIPLLVIAAGLQLRTGWSVSQRALMVGLAAGAIYGAIFVGLRLYYGDQDLILVYDNRPGIELLTYNLTNHLTWVNLAATLNIVPLLALAAWPHWPVMQRRFFWVIVPVWFAIHMILSALAETRLMLVPQALVFIPGALFGLAARGRCDEV